MACQDGKLRENDGESIEDLAKNYIPEDQDNEPDSDYHDDDDNPTE